MDDIGFDRIARTLSASGVRRQALRASLSGVVAMAAATISHGADAKKSKKSDKKSCKSGKQTRCRTLTEICSAGGECCGAEIGAASCKVSIKSGCAASHPGVRCCGLEGIACSTECDCCDNMVCTTIARLSGTHCQAPPT